jgi:hypothetical protein
LGAAVRRSAAVGRLAAEPMKKTFWLVFMLAACTSAEEKARAREQAMIEQAKADSVAEAEFVEDSSRLAASISVDTIREVRTRDQRTEDDGVETAYLAISPKGQACLLTFEKYRTAVVGDTLSCQWTPP